MVNERNRSSSHTPHRRTSSGRISVPSARSELESERERYSAHDERFSGGTPAERYGKSYAPRRQIDHDDYAAQPQYGQRVPRAGQRPTRRRLEREGQPHRRSAQSAGRMGERADGRADGYASRRANGYANSRSGNYPNGRTVPESRERSDARWQDPASTGAYSAVRYRRASGAERGNVAQSDESYVTGNFAPVRRGGASAYDADRYSERRKSRPVNGHAVRRTFVSLAVLVAVVFVGVFGYQAWANAQPIEVTVNGQEVTLQADQRSVDGILDAGIASATPGNYLAVDGSTLREGEGARCTAQVNDADQPDLGARLNEGDVITISDGTDITEGYTDSDVEVLPYSVEVQGVGAVHLYVNEGENGEKVTRTGNESGITTDIVAKEPVNRTVQYYNVDTHGDKVIALTFDDGPWDSQTAEVLDILSENGAKATFFTVGSCISGREDVVKRAADEGHQISTHTYDHAEGSGQGVSLILMSDEERKTEITKGYEAIEAATGQEASTVVRCPGGNFDTSVATSLDGLITAEIGWNVDTNDWRRPGADTIAQRIESASAGSIVLMHDGGGDRSQTIEGLRQALPVLKEQGYEFVTVQELLERYPYEG